MALFSMIAHGSLQFGACQESLEEKNFYHSQVDGWYEFLKVLQKHPEIGFCINIQGYDLEWISKYYKKDILGLMGELIHIGQIEYLPGGYSHIFPSFPYDYYKKNLEIGMKLAEKMLNLNASDFSGYALPEGMFNNGLISMCKEAGLKYIVFDKASSLTNIHNPYPLTLVAPNGDVITGLPFGDDTHPGFHYYFHTQLGQKSLDQTPEGIYDELQIEAQEMTWESVVSKAQDMEVMTVYSDWEGSYCCGHTYKQIDKTFFLYRNTDEGMLEKLDTFFSMLEMEPSIEAVRAIDIINHHPPMAKTKLYDGIGSKANRFDVARLAQGSCFDSKHKHWNSHPQMADVETLSYPFQAYCALKQLLSLEKLATGPKSSACEIEDWKQALVPACSAWAGSAPDYRVKKQITDPVSALKLKVKTTAAKIAQKHSIGESGKLVVINPHPFALNHTIVSHKLTFVDVKCKSVTFNDQDIFCHDIETDQNGYMVSCVIVFCLSLKENEIKEIPICLSDDDNAVVWTDVSSNGYLSPSKTLDLRISGDHGGNLVTLGLKNRESLINLLGYSELRLGLDSPRWRDVAAAKLSLLKVGAGICIKSVSVSKKPSIHKRWHIFPDKQLIHYECSIQTDSAIELHMGGVELNSNCFDETGKFTKLTEIANDVQSHKLSENLTWHPLGNALFNYSHGNCGFTGVVDKEIDTAAYANNRYGGKFVYARQDGCPEFFIPFKNPPKVRMIYKVNPYGGLKEEDLVLAQSMLIKPILHFEYPSS